MANFIPGTPAANTTLSIKEESSITGDKIFEHVTQEILQLSPAKTVTLEQWMKHLGFNCILEFSPPTIMLPNRLVKNQAMLTRVIKTKHFLSPSLPPLFY